MNNISLLGQQIICPNRSQELWLVRPHLLLSQNFYQPRPPNKVKHFQQPDDIRKVGIASTELINSAQTSRKMLEVIKLNLRMIEKPDGVPLKGNTIRGATTVAPEKQVKWGTFFIIEIILGTFS